MLNRSKYKLNTFIIFLLALYSQLFFQHPACSALSNKELTIVHTNDVHGHLEPFDQCDGKGWAGGAARHSTIFKSIRHSDKNVLTLDAGDFAQGTLYFKAFDADASLKIDSYLKYDALELGNHEFDKGLGVLENIVKKADFPILCANLKFKNNDLLDKKIQDYIIKDYKGLKIGVIGVITPSLKALSKDLNAVEIQDPVPVLQKLVKEVDKKTDLVVVLSHCGLDEDIKIAKAVEGIDVIVGGHSHTKLQEPVVVNNKNNRVLILQSGAYGANIGKLNLSVGNDKIQNYSYKLISVNNSVESDRHVSDILNPYNEKLKAYKEDVVGVLGDDVEARRSKLCTGLQTGGALVNEAIKDKFEDVDIVIQNSGGLRVDKVIKKGPITREDVFSFCPFENKIVLAEISGKDLKSILETSSKGYPVSDEAFLQTMGIEYTIDLNGTSQKLSQQLDKIEIQGNRVKNIKINGCALDLNKYYKVALNDFIFNGGDGYIQFKNAKNVMDTGVFVGDVIIDYIKENSPLFLKVDDKVDYINQLNSVK